MYKSIFKINYDISKIANIGKEVPWQEQCMFTELMKIYLPKHIKRIMPKDNQIILEWDEEDSFERFIQEDLYFNILKVLSRYDVYIEWS